VSKNKPKETIEYVFRLQDKERQLIDDFLLAKNFNNVASPVVALLSDVSGLAASYVILNALFPEWSKGLSLQAMRSMDSPGIFDYLESQNLVLGVIGAGAGIATGGLAWIPALLGFAVGQIAAELGEEAYKNVKGISNSVNFKTFMFSLYMAAYAKDLTGSD
tara:strand:+ start:247 stop:732 length:486 start_codon:yes stop_codon:yes gene_type:complete